MARVGHTDLVPLSMYRHVRDDYLRRVIALKARRRIDLGEVTVQFECRETVLFQIHEVLRIAHELRPHQILATVDEYAPLVPGPAQLSVTVLVHGGALGWIEMLGRSLATTCDALSLDIDGRAVRATPVSPPAHASCPVHYVRFHLDAGHVRALRDPTARVQMSLRCGPAWAAARLDEAARRELVADACRGDARPTLLSALVAATFTPSTPLLERSA